MCTIERLEERTIHTVLYVYFKTSIQYLDKYALIELALAILLDIFECSSLHINAHELLHR